MPAVAYEVHRPVPPVLHAPIMTVLGPGTIEHVWGHLLAGGWCIGAVLLKETKTPLGFYTNQIDLEVEE